MGKFFNLHVMNARGRPINLEKARIAFNEQNTEDAQIVELVQAKRKAGRPKRKV